MGPIPASLKPIQPFLNKAEEMKSADPVVSYYCSTWAVQYAISIGLKDTESKIFLASLLDTLEKTKSAMSTVDAITDDIVGKAYMENFATNIFQRADDEERGKKATRNTATKFLAASQFMEVLRCFGELDKETGDKIRYAKFQCARILKALKAGEDPNKRDPAEEEDGNEEQPPVTPYVSPKRTFPPVDGTSLSAQSMNQAPSEQSQYSSSSNPPPVMPFRQASGGGETNSFDPPTPNDRPQNTFTPPPPSQQPPSFSIPPRSPLIAPPQQPLRHSPPTNSNPFPPPSLPLNPYSSPKPPPPPPAQSQFSPPPQSPYTHQPPQPPPSDPANYYTNYTPSSPSHPTNPYSQASAPPQDPRQYTHQLQPRPFNPSQPPPQPPQIPPQHLQSPSYFPPQSLPVAQTSAPPASVVVDDEAMAKAQKHARWAISALNYEDVETAVKELRTALSSLGVK